MRHAPIPPIAVLLLIAAMLGLQHGLDSPALLPTPWQRAGWLPLLTGLLMAQSHARLFRRLGTEIHTFREPGQLVQAAGLYRHTRNPMYVGMLLLLAGLALLLNEVAVWLGPMAFWLLLLSVYLPHEERAMAARFGAAYADYCARVPRWWRWRPAQVPQKVW